MADTPDRHGRTLSQRHREMADLLVTRPHLLDMREHTQRLAWFDAGFTEAEVESGHVTAVRLARTLLGEPKALGTARAI